MISHVRVALDAVLLQKHSRLRLSHTSPIPARCLRRSQFQWLQRWRHYEVGRLARKRWSPCHGLAPLQLSLDQEQSCPGTGAMKRATIARSGRVRHLRKWKPGLPPHHHGQPLPSARWSRRYESRLLLLEQRWTHCAGVRLRPWTRAAEKKSRLLPQRFVKQRPLVRET